MLFLWNFQKSKEKFIRILTKNGTKYDAFCLFLINKFLHGSSKVNTLEKENLTSWYIYLYQGWPTRGPKRNFCGPKLESRISNFSIFWVYFVTLLLCGPKSLYFWQIFQVAAHRSIWVGYPWSIHPYYFKYFLQVMAFRIIDRNLFQIILKIFLFQSVNCKPIMKENFYHTFKHT